MLVIYVVVSHRVTHNGPAIKGGCVTRRKHRAASCFFSREIVTVQGGYGACFCHPVASFLSFTSVAVQVLLRAGHLSPYTGLIESSGAVTVMSPYNVILLTAGNGLQKP